MTRALFVVQAICWGTYAWTMVLLLITAAKYGDFGYPFVSGVRSWMAD